MNESKHREGGFEDINKRRHGVDSPKTTHPGIDIDRLIELHKPPGFSYSISECVEKLVDFSALASSVFDEGGRLLLAKTAAFAIARYAIEGYYSRAEAEETAEILCFKCSLEPAPKDEGEFFDASYSHIEGMVLPFIVKLLSETPDGCERAWLYFRVDFRCHLIGVVLGAIERDKGKGILEQLSAEEFERVFAEYYERSAPHFQTEAFLRCGQEIAGDILRDFVQDKK